MPMIGHVKRSEWKALSQEARAKLEKLTCSLPREYYFRQAEGREKLRRVPLVRSEAQNPPATVGTTGDPR